MPTSAASVQTLLILRENQHYSFVWNTPTRAHWHSLTLTTGQEQELARTFEQATQEATHLPHANQSKPGQAEQTLLRLGRTMFQQLLSEAIQEELRALPANTPLSLVTNDTLLPWELLTVDDTPLALRHLLSRQWLTTASRPSGQWLVKPQMQCLLISDPTGDLPAATAESEALIKVLDAAADGSVRTDWFNDQINQAQFLAHLASREYDLVHFAGHARPGALRLADGWLAAEQIQPAVHGSPFIFLNACASAQAQGAPGAALSLAQAASASPYAGQAITSLASAFLAGGASGFLGTLWPVADETACQLAVDFYRLALQGHSTGAALQQARRRSKQQASHTLVWAAATLYGDPLQQLFASGPQQRTGSVMVVEQPLATVNSLLDATPAQYALDQSRMRQWSQVVQRYGGRVVAITPAQMTAVFGADQTLEDDAERALLTGQALVSRADDNQPTPPGIGVASGPFVMATQPAHPADLAQYAGEAVTSALQLARQAQPGEVLVNGRTRRLTLSRFTFVALAETTGQADLVTPPAAGPRDSGRYRWLMDAERGDERDRPPLLVERDAALAQLQACWQLAVQGQGGVVAVAGEPGVGKSVLVETFCVAQPPQSIHCLRLVAHKVNVETPLAFLADFLRVLLEIPSNPANATTRLHLEERLAEFPALVANPGLIDLLVEILGITRSTLGEEERKRLRPILTRLVWQLLRAASQRASVCVLWEDVHYMDADSCELLLPVTERSDQHRLLLVLTYRNGWSNPWQNESTPIHLRPLSVRGVQQLLLQLLESDHLPTTLQEALQKLDSSERNPSDLVDWVAYLQETGILQRGAAQWHITRPLQVTDLPDTLKRSQLVQFERLDPTQQQTLRVAAVVEQGFTPRLLAAVLAETEAELIDQLAALQAKRLIGQDLQGFGYRFSKAKLRDVIYAELSVHQRATLHREVADALCDEPNHSLFQLVYHYAASNDRASAARYGLQAAEQAAAEWNNQSALAQYTRAAAKAQDLAESKPTVLEEKRGATAEMIKTWWRTSLEGGADLRSRIGENDLAIALYQELIATAYAFPPLSSPKQADLLRKLAIAQHNSGQLEQARQAVEQGLTLLATTDCTEKGRLLSWQSILAFRQADYTTALNISQQACAQLQFAPSDLAQARNLQCILYQRLGNLTAAMAAGEESVANYRQLNHLLGLARALSNLGIVYLNLGQWSEALGRFREGQEICAETGESRQYAATSMDLGEVYRRQGKLAEALACHQQAYQQGQALAMPEIQGAALLNLGVVYLKLGQWAAADQALTHCDQLLQEYHLNLYQAELLRSQAELALHQGQPAAARLAALAAQQLAEQAGEGTEVALAQRILGQIERRQQNFIEAEAHLTASLAYLQQQGNRYESAITLLELAFLAADQLPLMSSTAERAMQQELAVIHGMGALRTFISLGAQLDQELAQQLLQQLQ